MGFYISLSQVENRVAYTKHHNMIIKNCSDKESCVEREQRNLRALGQLLSTLAQKVHLVTAQA